MTQARDEDVAVADGIRRLHFLNIALASKAGKDGDLKQACDMASAAIASALAAAREEEREHETFASCGRWADETFGPATALRRIARAEEEIEEAKTAPPGKLLEEIADAVICLAAAAHSAGGDLQEAIDKKMAINRQRQWALRGDGTGYHIRSRQTTGEK